MSATPFYLRGVLVLLASGVVAFFIILLVSGCAAPEEPDHWRDAVKSNKGLIRGS